MKLKILIFSIVIIGWQIQAMESSKVDLRITNNTNDKFIVMVRARNAAASAPQEIFVKSLDISLAGQAAVSLPAYDTLNIFNVEKGDLLNIINPSTESKAFIDENSFPQLFTDKGTSIFTVTSDAKGELILQRTTDPRLLNDIIMQEEAKVETGAQTSRFSGFGERLGHELNAMGREEFLKEYEKDLSENIQIVKMLVEPAIGLLTPVQVLNALHYEKLSQLSDKVLNHLQAITDPEFVAVIEDESIEQANVRREKAKVIKGVIDTLVKKKKIINNFLPELGDKIGILDLLLDDKISSIHDGDVLKIFGYYTTSFTLDPKMKDKIHQISLLLHDYFEPYVAGETREQAALRNNKAAVIKEVFKTVSKTLSSRMTS